MTLAPYIPIVWLNVPNNSDWVLQSIGILSVRCSGVSAVGYGPEH